MWVDKNWKSWLQDSNMFPKFAANHNRIQFFAKISMHTFQINLRIRFLLWREIVISAAQNYAGNSGMKKYNIRIHSCSILFCLTLSFRLTTFLTTNDNEIRTRFGTVWKTATRWIWNLLAKENWCNSDLVNFANWF